MKLSIHLAGSARARSLALLAGLAAFSCASLAQPAPSTLPLFDAHVHYSHDAVQQIGPDKVIALMRQAGLKRVMVSSSDDEGTQKLYAAAPELIVPSLRPYRLRSDLSTWVRDSAIIQYLEQRLARYQYAAIGEFHLYGADADLPVPRRMIELSRQHKLILHAHSDSDAIERIFRQAPQATVLWAHSGFERPENVAQMLRKFPGLFADLAYRTDQASPEWSAVFRELPDRFMVGTDTFTPERLYYIPDHARFSREWLNALPADVAEKIAWRNGEKLIASFWKPAAHNAACTLDGSPGQAAPQSQQASRSTVTISLPAALKTGSAFNLKSLICLDRPGEKLLRVNLDAQMPEHRHGMNYKPRQTLGPAIALAAGRNAHALSADGLVFHMPGRWQIEIRLQGVDEQGKTWDRTEEFFFNVLLK